MKPTLLVLGGVWPYWRQPREAANAVSNRLVWELAQTGQLRIIFGVVTSTPAPVPVEAQPDLEELEKAGVSFIEAILVGRMTGKLGRIARISNALLNSRWDRLLHGCGEERRVIAALGGRTPDAVLTIWSEVATAVAGGLNIPAFAYYGNLDYKVLDAQFELARLCDDRGVLAALGEEVKRRVLVGCIRKAHFSLMRKYHHVWNVAAHDAAEQLAGGVRASYLCNVWSMGDGEVWQTRRNRLEQEFPLKIVANVGNLSATGNSFGLLTLAREIIPAMKRILNTEIFQIHLFGGSAPRQGIANLLDDPCILIRGFVEDIDREILSAPVFLVANNHYKFKVGHTRILHAWSLGACVVAFEDMRQAMPELQHRENVLLGRDGKEIAELIMEAGADRQLRRRLGAGGLDTLRTHYNPRRVAREIADVIARAASA